MFIYLGTFVKKAVLLPAIFQADENECTHEHFQSSSYSKIHHMNSLGSVYDLQTVYCTWHRCLIQGVFLVSMCAVQDLGDYPSCLFELDFFSQWQWGQEDLLYLYMQKF